MTNRRGQVDYSLHGDPKNSHDLIATAAEDKHSQ